MPFRRQKRVSSLPLVGSAIVSVRIDGFVFLSFNDPARSRLTLFSTFALATGDHLEEYGGSGRLPPWLGDILDGLLNVPIVLVHVDRNSTLRLVFADGRSMLVPDGPYETWHYSSPAQSLYGGVGKVS